LTTKLYADINKKNGVASCGRPEIIPFEPDTDNAGVGKNIAFSINPSRYFPAEGFFIFITGRHFLRDLG